MTDTRWGPSAEKIAAWLDVRYPGWHEKVDTESLDMGNACNCLGGQLLGFDEGWSYLTEEMREDVPYDGTWCFAGEEQTPFIVEQIEQRRVRVPEVVPEEVPA